MPSISMFYGIVITMYIITVQSIIRLIFMHGMEIIGLFLTLKGI